MLQIIILLLAAGPVLAQGQYTLRMHENSRVMAMGGAFVALADDPQAGLLNPAGLKAIRRIGHDFSFSTGTGAAPDQLSTALANPGAESGASFGSGFVSQGVLTGESVKYYVPHTGASWRMFGRSSLGLGLRFPYRTSNVDTVDSKWETVADLSALIGFGYMHFGGQVERAFGGAADMVPRRLRTGVSMARPGLYAVSYEWRGAEQDSRYNFHYESSHIGAELVSQKYVAMRAGYVWSNAYHVTAGMAFGLIQAGWRIETGWQFPTTTHGELRWSVGVGYRG